MPYIQAELNALFIGIMILLGKLPETSLLKRKILLLSFAFLFSLFSIVALTFIVSSLS
jgi:hypothetical protein